VTYAIRVLGDKLREGDEWFEVRLSAPTGAALASSIARVTLVDDDGGTLLAAGTPTGDAPHGAAVLTARQQATTVLDAAIALWLAAGVAPSALQGVEVRIVDLPGRRLAETVGSVVHLDVDAAGHGWFVDPTPATSEEFSRGRAVAGSAAEGRVDLLSVLVHELGHVLGLDHASSGVMASTLGPGTRVLLAGCGRRWGAPAHRACPVRVDLGKAAATAHRGH
jgi:hypothetical protein